MPTAPAAPSPAQPGLTEPPPVHLDPDAPPIADEKSAHGAARRLLEYCDALATRRYPDAYRLWADGGKASGLTLNGFRSRFDGTTISDCQIGEPGAIEGAAGSLYIEVANVFRGTGSGGKPLRLDEPVLLKRVNDVDGSTAEQRRWHIARAPFPPRR